MEEKKGNRRVTITIGAQRSGKSFLTNEDIKTFLKSGQMAMVYNYGKRVDWDACIEGKLFDMQLHEEYIYDNLGSKALKEFRRFRKFRFFNLDSYNKGIHELKDMNAILYGKAVKFHRLDDKTEERLFYEYVKSVSNCLLVFDDALPIFNCNLKGWMNNLFTRVNHTGEQHTNPSYQGAGSDIVLIFHSLNQVPKAILDCYNEDWKFRTFRYSEEPDFKKIRNYELRTSLEVCFDIIKEEPKYSYTEYDRGETTLFRFLGGGKYEELSIDINL